MQTMSQIHMSAASVLSSDKSSRKTKPTYQIRAAALPANTGSEMLWGDQNARGKAIACALMSRILKTQFAGGVAFMVSDLTEHEPAGVLVGFLQEIAERALRGSYVQ